MATASSRRYLPFLLAVLIAGALPGCSLFGEKPDGALKAFLQAWQENKLGGQKLLSEDGQQLSGDNAQKLLSQLEGELAANRPKLTVKGEPKTKDDRATATVAVAWPVADGVTWEYTTTVALRELDEGWRPFFSPATVHPDLTLTDKLAIKRTAADRGQILDAAGQPLVTKRPVVVVGVEPRKITDLNLAMKLFGEAFKQAGVEVNLANLPDRVSKAKPDAFVEIVTLRKDAFDRVADTIDAIPGRVRRDSTMSLAPTRVFARALLGDTGEVTKEIMDKNPGRYRIGDVVGLAGLQQRYDAPLRGKAGVSVIIPAATAGGTPKSLFNVDPQAGGAVKTTIDEKTQNAADEALAPEKNRSALVAIRISDGAVLAVGNGPGPTQLNLAMTAQVPPGSTFKTVSALGLLENGSVTADTPVGCPKTRTVDGRSFKNAHNLEMPGAVPFHTVFAKSCNTSFAELAPKLGGDGLSKAAASLGIGVPWDLGADVFTGKVSANGPPAEQAAAAFGQGTNLVSPMALAGAAAGVARGQWKQPTLITEPAPAKVAPDGPALKPTSLDPLRAMMREVVTAGTADALKGVAGLHGKTGTAEYDNDPAHTHSWFIGFRGDIAFAAFVENGGASTDTAVPLVGRFLTKLG